MQELEQEIKCLVVESLHLEDVTPDDIDPTAPLFVEGLGLDSIDALELGAVLQKNYGIAMGSNSDENRQHFASVRALAEFVRTHRRS